MGAEKFTSDMLKQALAHIWISEGSAVVWRILKRRGFRPGDVTFRITKGTGKPWCDIHRWPWDGHPTIDPNDR